MLQNSIDTMVVLSYCLQVLLSMQLTAIGLRRDSVNKTHECKFRRRPANCYSLLLVF